MTQLKNENLIDRKQEDVEQLNNSTTSHCHLVKKKKKRKCTSVKQVTHYEKDYLNKILPLGT